MKWMELAWAVILFGFVLVGCSSPDEETIYRLQDENQKLKDEKIRLEANIASLQEEIVNLRDELAGNAPSPQNEPAVQREDPVPRQRHFRRRYPTLPSSIFPDNEPPRRSYSNSRSYNYPPDRTYPSYRPDRTYPSRPNWNTPTPTPTPRSRDLIQPVPPCDQHHHGMCVDRDGGTHTRRRR